MGKLTDVAIRNWIKAGELLEGCSDGEGLPMLLPQLWHFIKDMLPLS